MDIKPEHIINASAIIFGFSIAFFHSWAYSSTDPYEMKHLLFLLPLFAAEIVLGITIVLTLVPATTESALKYGPFFVGMALLLLMAAQFLSVVIEWKK